MAERFGTLPIAVRRTCSWEMMFATLEVVSELDEYREWKSKKHKKSKGHTVDEQGFLKMFGNVGPDGRITG